MPDPTLSFHYPPPPTLDAKALEIVARRVCELRGLDPDKSIPHGAAPDEHGVVLAILLHSPRWMLVAAEVKTWWEIQTACDNCYDWKAKQ